MTEQEQIAALREALEPFAHFARQWNATPIRGLDDVLYAIHGGDLRGELRLTDCQRALAALEALDRQHA